MLAGRYGQFNQAGDLYPKTGAQSTLIRKNLTRLINFPQPIVGRTFFHDYIGAAVFPGVNDVIVVQAKGYGGSLPAATQPTSVRPLPWDVAQQVE